MNKPGPNNELSDAHVVFAIAAFALSFLAALAITVISVAEEVWTLEWADSAVTFLFFTMIGSGAACFICGFRN